MLLSKSLLWHGLLTVPRSGDRGTTRPKPRAWTFRPRVEALEDRCLPSGMAPLAFADSFEAQVRTRTWYQYYDPCGPGVTCGDNPPPAQSICFVSGTVAAGSIAPGVLANDHDPEADALTAVLVTRPSSGQFTFNPDGSFFYFTEFSGRCGTKFSDKSFTYKASDGTSVSEPVKATIGMETTQSELDEPIEVTLGSGTTTESGGTDQIRVWLKIQPLANVTIPIFSSDASEGTVSTASVNFTPQNWSTAQTVTITGVDDPIYDDAAPYIVATRPAASSDPAYNGMDADDVVMRNSDNDPPPSISVADVKVYEGNAGTVEAIFTVRLSATSGVTTTVNYATADGTGHAGIDYQAASGTLTFNPGETTKTITVLVKGDTVREKTETFFLNLTGAVNATIADAQALATILNDDR